MENPEFANSTPKLLRRVCSGPSGWKQHRSGLLQTILENGDYPIKRSLFMPPVSTCWSGKVVAGLEIPSHVLRRKLDEGAKLRKSGASAWVVERKPRDFGAI
jgi:hypothetical protein